MSILDRYLLRQFAKTFFIFFCSFTGLYFVIDVFGNLDEFLNYTESHGSLLAVLFDYYSYRTLTFFNMIAGILALIAAMFTVTSFRSGNEMTALLVAGISKKRIVLPIIIGALTISLVATANRELIIPKVRDKISRNAQDLSGDMAHMLKPRYDNETDILFRGTNLYAKDQRIEGPDFLLPPELRKYGKYLIAREAFYQCATGDRPGGYLLKSVIQPKTFCSKPSLTLNKKRVVLTPTDTDWLEPDDCFVITQVTFEQLEGGTQWKRMASTSELIQGIHNPSLDFGADVRVTIHSRLVQPMLDVTLIFLGLPLVLRREQHNVFMAIALCGLVVIGFMLLVMGCQYLGGSYLISPARAAWLPLIICVPIAVFISEPLRE